MITKNKKAILFIEDNPLLANLYSAGLKDSGVDVIIVHNGEDGLKAIEEHQPDVVILDIRMPGMDGIEVLKEIRKNPKTKDLKVIILTVSDAERDKKMADKLGVAEYIMKSDMHINDVVQKILTYLKS